MLKHTTIFLIKKKIKRKNIHNMNRWRRQKMNRRKKEHAEQFRISTASQWNASYDLPVSEQLKITHEKTVHLNDGDEYILHLSPFNTWLCLWVHQIWIKCTIHDNNTNHDKNNTNSVRIATTTKPNYFVCFLLTINVQFPTVFGAWILYRCMLSTAWQILSSIVNGRSETQYRLRDITIGQKLSFWYIRKMDRERMKRTR